MHVLQIFRRRPEVEQVSYGRDSRILVSGAILYALAWGLPPPPDQVKGVETQKSRRSGYLTKILA